MKEKICFFKPLMWAVIIMNIVAIIVAAFLRGRSEQYTYEYVNGEIITSNGLRGFLIAGYIYAGIVLVLLIMALIQVIIFRKEMSFILNLCVVLAFVPISYGLIHVSVKSIVDIDNGYKSVCYEYTDNEHVVVISEKDNGKDSCIEVFQIVDNGDVYLLGDFSTLDGYTNKGEYDIEWSDTAVTIQYSVDGKLDLVETLKFKK